MALLPDLEALVRSFLPVRRSLAQKMCVAAFGRVQEDRQQGYEFGTALTFKEMRTHTRILSNCRRFGVAFGPAPTVASLMAHLRIIEEFYLCVECADESTRLDLSAWAAGAALAVVIVTCGPSDQAGNRECRRSGSR